MYPVTFIDWGHITPANLNGKWEKMPEDPLLILIAHRDDGGKIYPEHAAALADRLEELLPELGDEDGGGHIGLYRDKTEKFIRGCRKAAKAGKKLKFR